MPTGIYERNKPKTILICKQCGKEFEITESSKNRKYCSQECYWKSIMGNKFSEELYPNHGMRNKNHSEESKKKMSKDRKGKPNIYWKGKYHSEETKRKISKGLEKANEQDLTLRERTGGSHKGLNFPKELYTNYGNRNKLFTEGHKNKIGLANKDKHRSEEEKLNLRKINIGKHHSKETKKKISKISTIHWQNPDIRSKIIKGMTKYFNQPEAREKCRKAWEKRAESSGYPRNYLIPNFNLDSIYILKLLDKILHTRSRYGGTKAGEKKIGRYYMDYFNKKYQLIIEWNEKFHYNFNGDIREYDIKKRKYILDKHPNYNYIIIRQSDWFKKDELTKNITVKIVNYILEKIKILEG